MDWRQVLEQLDNRPSDDDLSALEALKQLNDTITAALMASIKEDRPHAREKAIEALPQLLKAMHVLGVDPLRALRQQAADVPPTTERLIYIEGNRVEVRVDNELRGSWSIWSIADLKEVCRLAEEFDCGLVYSIIGDLQTSEVAVE